MLDARADVFAGFLELAVFAFASVFLDSLLEVALEAALEACAKTFPGKMQAKISARTQPNLIDPSSCARRFCFFPNVQTSEHTPLHHEHELKNKFFNTEGHGVILRIALPSDPLVTPV